MEIATKTTTAIMMTAMTITAMVRKGRGLPNEFELEVTASPVEVLLPKLASGEWSSVDVTKAFYKRAIIAHQAIFVDKALERAAYLDEELKKTGKPIGPLHGLHISLRDQLANKGFETTMGEQYVYAL
ncbi:hypothetical protein M422DRAFT_273411 [Sphaerobolus stellatus SS14]|uniref:Amidase domain-containing protein n=1 Tax=Sphaerobolus stellatus (strain SS14) TaxID=990650 RepID=A0A0C9T941_SPHS4|nr:hypothetical protein M422DRAFT_273411 [Sphaerobolus stellatus SS14]